MLRGFSLDGASFVLHGLPRHERQDLEALVLANHGALLDAANPHKTDFVYALTGYWSDCEPAVLPLGILVRRVTRFWLQETLRLGRWLRTDSHPFFEPPPRPRGLHLQYPAGFQDQGEVDRDGDVKMEDPAGPSHQARMPFSPSCLFRGEVPLWPYVAAFLAQPMQNAQELAARLQVITLSDPRRRFNCLEYAVTELLTHEEQAAFFQVVLPEMVRLVLAMPQTFATPPPLLTPLEQGEESSAEGAASTDAGRKARVVTQSHRFTKLEVLTLVCGCFFGVFPDQDIAKATAPELSPPRRKAGRRGDDDGVIQFPYFTAVRMFSAPGPLGRMVVLKAQKIRCLLQYFLRVVPRALSDRAALSAEVIDFTRVGVDLPLAPGRTRAEQTPQDLLETLAAASDSTDAASQAQGAAGVDTSPRLYGARCVSDTLIEDLEQHLQVDFANKFAGGGVLNSGCVQEEIRFLLSPELLVSCLVFAKLEPHEAFVVHGTERYSSYLGYGGSFAYGGDFQDTTRLAALPDGGLRRACAIVGIDATDYGSARVERQYTRGHVRRDLVKAYAGFAYPEAHEGGHCWPVATGNWGCGVFRGDRELKFLIQWLAASLRHRELVYVLFERDLDLQAKVDPLLALAASPEAREWDRRSGGVTQWLAEFLFNELSAERGARGEQSVLARASLSLQGALAALPLPEERQQQPESPVSSEPEPNASGTSPRRGEPSDEGAQKRPKTAAKELHQRTMQDFFSPK